jgi:hypothetical protein
MMAAIVWRCSVQVGPGEGDSYGVLLKGDGHVLVIFERSSHLTAKNLFAIENSDNHSHDHVEPTMFMIIIRMSPKR